MDVAAIALGHLVFRHRRRELAGLGYLRPDQRLCDRHWLVGHFSHRKGEQSWIPDGAAAQGYNVRSAGLISMGESWHNNHHAFPGSAKGLFPGQADLGWWLIKTFEAAGLATNIKTPDDLAPRDGLRRLTTTACIGHQPELRLP